MTQGFLRVLCKGKKKPWPIFPLIIEPYVVENLKQVETEAEALKGCQFVIINYWTYDPKKVVVTHCKRVKFNWSYSHTRQDHEDGVKNWYNVTREINPSEKQEREKELLDTPRKMLVYKRNPPP